MSERVRGIVQRGMGSKHAAAPACQFRIVRGAERMQQSLLLIVLLKEAMMRLPPPLVVVGAALICHCSGSLPVAGFAGGGFAHPKWDVKSHESQVPRVADVKEHGARPFGAVL